jgi:RNA polymerase sigma-70 factor (ECF subfamily)
VGTTVGGLREDLIDTEARRAGRQDSERNLLSLYREHGETVFRLLCRMTEDEANARDLTHDTFVRVFERWDQYSGRGTTASWICRIAANLARDRRGQSRSRARLLAREAPSFARYTADDSGKLESRMLLDEALGQLPDEQRVTLLLYEVDGYSHAEIAEMLGVAEGTSRARVSRAKETLRELLDGRI